MKETKRTREELERILLRLHRLETALGEAKMGETAGRRVLMLELIRVREKLEYQKVQTIRARVGGKVAEIGSPKPSLSASSGNAMEACI